MNDPETSPSVLAALPPPEFFIASEFNFLRRADLHVARAEDRLVEMARIVAQESEAGFETGLSEAALAACQHGLAAFREHRALILENLECLYRRRRARLMVITPPRA